MDDLDRILSSEPAIEPSPAFAARVLDSVRRESRAPSPIPFPWARLLPALVCLAIAGAVLIAQAASRAALSPAAESFLTGLAREAAAYRAGYVLLAMGVAGLTPRLSRRFLES